MSNLLLPVDWQKIFDDSAAESVQAFQQLRAVDWQKMFDSALAESAKAFQQLEAVDWQKIINDFGNEDTNDRRNRP